jgi:transcriptional regulator with XRE-family HTH domain
MARRLTQQQLAQRLGVLIEAVARWERGKAMPSRERLTRCARALGVTEHWLLTGEVSPAIVVPPACNPPH